MKVCVIGSGYVGLVTGAGLAEVGHSVVCVDASREKIDLLNRGEILIYEHGLGEMCERNKREGRLSFSVDIGRSIRSAQVVIIAVGTPEQEDGLSDLTAVFDVAEIVARNIREYTAVVCKSTVPVGTGEKVWSCIKGFTDVPFSIVSNPEFLKEGEAVVDFMNPSRIVVGVEDERSEKLMRDLYMPLLGYNGVKDKMIMMDIRSAEMSKYAVNAFLAMRITFINEIANLCERVGADVTKVRVGAGTDPRMGLHYSSPGCGYGGSCFPKDTRSLLKTSQDLGVDLDILRAVDRVNDRQKLIPFEKIKKYFGGDLVGKRVTVWGLAFKPGTDDVRESPANYIVGSLLLAGVNVVVHDPVAMDNFKRRVSDRPVFVKDKYAALKGSDALIIVTDWDEYREANLELVFGEQGIDVVMDGRNIWKDAKIPPHVTYMGIGFSGKNLIKREGERKFAFFLDLDRFVN